MPGLLPVCDNYAPNLQQAVELCPGAKAYTDYRKLWNRQILTA